MGLILNGFHYNMMYTLDEYWTIRLSNSENSKIPNNLKNIWFKFIQNILCLPFSKVWYPIIWWYDLVTSAPLSLSLDGFNWIQLLQKRDRQEPLMGFLQN